jgi:hypothetical protein
VEAELADSEAAVKALTQRYDRPLALLAQDRDALAAQQCEYAAAQAAACAAAESVAVQGAQAEQRRMGLLLEVRPFLGVPPVKLSL